MRLTADARAARVAEIVSREPNEPWLIFCNTDYESDALQTAFANAHINDYVEVRGSQSDAVKERGLLNFIDGKVRILISKPSIAGLGLNLQHCARVAFVGLSWSWEQFYQALRRCWRFGQLRPVHAYVVMAETEGPVLASIQMKERQATEMRTNMVAATREGLRMEDNRELIKVNRTEARGKGWILHLGDCVEVCRDLPSDQMDFTIFSPPFAGLYIYSEAEADMGNSSSDEEFFRHFGYLAPELLRITVPGRLCAIHCKDLPKYANRDGMSGLKDFPGACVRLFEDAGWCFHSRVTIWKCPVVERERTNNNGLLHKTIIRDSSQVRQGMADFLLVFRKLPLPGDGLMSAKPIVRPEGLKEFIGEQDADPRKAGSRKHPSPYSRKPKVDSPSIAVWQRYADPVWWDIDQMDTLNEKAARDGQDEKHICPLQMGLIRRSVHLWSLPGETIFSPFAGIGSEGVVALQERRQFVGAELKKAYWERACRNIESARPQAGLFDHLEDEQ
jgi:hypothetical protein